MRLFDEARDGPTRDAIASLARWPGVQQKDMMGCACFWAEGKMFAFAANGCVVLTKLTGEEQRKLGGEPFWTGPGRPPIRKWTQVRVAERGDVAALKPLLRACYERALAEAE
ncbi:MAG: TfoX/Sxy family protein [Halobacteriales archaeon]|nr:TfoX/Sxy family protein [Halobacteriales archaeon]